MPALLLTLAAGLFCLGWWTTTLRAFELQVLVGAELMAFGAVFALLGLLQHCNEQRRH